MKNKFTDSNIGNYTIIKASNLRPCVKCGELTEYIDYCYEARICSKECEDKLTKDIMNKIN